MQMRDFGRYGRVSALALGGGGIGNVWGAVERAEAVATVQAAVEDGITLIDVAPTYGPGEAESVVGEAFGGALPDGVRITTKAELPDEVASERRIADSVRASLDRMRVERVDLFLLHSQLAPDDGPADPRMLTVRGFHEVVRPAFERLAADGLIGGWGLTAVAHPRALRQVLEEDPQPAAVQCVANALDMTGDMWILGPDEHPDNAGIRASAVAAGVPVIGIRAVAAGSLADSLDRDVPPDHPAARDFAAAAGFRALAAEHGVSAAFLAHRYALSLPDLATVVLGVKNREELAECVAAEEAGPLPEDELRAIEGLRSPHSASG
jgi:aryl-alcohol dehydrogenase-like predicted oxidoreductase